MDLNNKQNDINIINIKNKEKVYKKERQEIVNKIINITGTQFVAHEFDADIEKQNKILELDNDIKKYFSVSNWGAYKTGIKITKRPISIIKSVLKDMNIELISKITMIRKNNKTTSLTEYMIDYKK